MELKDVFDAHLLHLYISIAYFNTQTKIQTGNGQRQV